MSPESRRPRVVIDTDVWISAFLIKTSVSAYIVKRLLSEQIACFSEVTFAELSTRLWRPKFDRYLSLEDRRHLLHDVQAAAHWVEVPADIAAQSWSRDPADDPFIHVALAAGASWLVTGDDDLLSVPAVAELQILTPAKALQALGQAGSRPSGSG